MFNKSSTVVIPQAVDVDSSLQVSGTADDWSIQWPPATVHHGSVYYHVTLRSNHIARLHRVGIYRSAYQTDLNR